MIAFVKNYFLEEDKAMLQVSDLAIQRGYGIFDFFRISDNMPLFLDDYLARFFNSASIMRLQPGKSREELADIIYELIKRNSLAESGIKILLTGGNSPDGYEIATPNLIVLQQKLPVTPPEKFRNGIKVITYEYQRDLPEIKSINYLMGVWLQQKVTDQQADDVLYHSKGVVSEFPRSNIFIVTHDETIVTPSNNILHGITRKKLLELAASKYTVEVRDLNIEEVKNAAEVFMTSTTKRLLSINQVDDIIIGNGRAGQITAALTKHFLDMEKQELQNRYHAEEIK